jgi:hypothetical protein
MVTNEKPYKMTLEQFKELMLSNKAKKVFHDVMKQVKKAESRKILDDERKIYFPMNLNGMLNHLYMRMKHENIYSAIQGG